MSSDALTAATSSSSILEIPTPDTVILAPDRTERTVFDFDRVIGPSEVLAFELSSWAPYCLRVHADHHHVATWKHRGLHYNSCVLHLPVLIVHPMYDIFPDHQHFFLAQAGNGDVSMGRIFVRHAWMLTPDFILRLISFGRI